MVRVPGFRSRKEKALCAQINLDKESTLCFYLFMGAIKPPPKIKNKMSYSTSYTSSNGQPSNNEQTHESLAAALTVWQSNIGALILRSGGKSVLIDNDDEAQLVWVEHCEGGYVTAQGGAWQDDISNAAQIASEDGETLTAEKAADLINR